MKPSILVVVVTLLLVGCQSPQKSAEPVGSKVSSEGDYDAANELAVHDLGQSATAEDLLRYKARMEWLQKLTGSSPQEIARVTLEQHERFIEDNAMHCFQFMSALGTWTVNLSPDPDAGEYYKWDNYEQAARAFVEWVQTDKLPQ